ncbi:transposase [Streptomyces benahoarensis]|nr:transposase [Streptomyces benahoarensis]
MPMCRRMTREYPDELRERATREVRATGRPLTHVAKDLGIHKEALRGWVRQAEADRRERDWVDSRL